MNNFNILIISTVPYQKNGISVVIENLYCNNTSKQNNIVFIFPQGSDSAMVKELEEYGYRVILQSHRLSSPVSYMRFLSSVMKNGNFDIVHVHGNSATSMLELLPAVKNRIKTRILHAHATTSNHLIVHKILRPFLNLLCNGRFACSEQTARWMFGKKECTVIKNSFNVSNYRFNINSRDKYREKYNLSGKTVIGHIGGLNKNKNQLFLIDVFKKYLEFNPDSALVLVGEGELRGKIEAKTQELGINEKVILTGSINGVNQILNAFDYFVFPSVFEGFGIAPVEAQANGLPVLAADSLPKTVKVNPNFTFLPLENGAQYWAEQLANTSATRFKNAVESIIEAGFDINDEVLKLNDIYHNLAN